MKPASDAEVRQIAGELGISEDAARRQLERAAVSGTERGGQITTI